MNKQTFLLVAVVVIGLGGYWAYESYQEQKRMEAWESLLTGDDCDTCAARKASIKKIQDERKAKEAAEQESAVQSSDAN